MIFYRMNLYFAAKNKYFISNQEHLPVRIVLRGLMYYFGIFNYLNLVTKRRRE